MTDHTERGWRAYLSADHRQLTKRGVVLFVLTGAALAAAALFGVTWIAGIDAVTDRITGADWTWLAVALAGVAVSYLGYLFAYREVVRAQGGPTLDPTHAAALVAVGFGVFVPRGGFALDRTAWCESDLSSREAQQRVLNLAILEYAVLAPATLVAAAVTLLAFRTRVRRPRWLWRHLCPGLDAIVSTLDLLRTRAGLLAVAGMGLYWAGDIAALGACFHAIAGSRPSLPVLIVGYATGYALTRRSLPLAGAGAVELLLPFALSWVSLPLASSVVAVFAYRLFNLWLPVLPGVVGLRHLRRRSRRRGRSRARAKSATPA
jgi:uncharacterized membrane protein YbhN (UPF0104 family)